MKSSSNQNRTGSSMSRGRRSMFRCAILRLLKTCLVLPFTGVGLGAQPHTNADSLPALVRVLAESKDARIQADILKGLSAAFKGRRHVPMPRGWEQIETWLGQSPHPEVRALSQSLSLTFGSTRAREA